MTSPVLLDVNVVVALFDPEHIHHEIAHSWFGGSSRGRWATCPLTENGFVRIVSNPGYSGRRVSLAEATRRLALLCEHQDHVFWQDSVTVRNFALFNTATIQGYRQLTDVYLLALAVANEGALATFDRSITLSTVAGASRHHLLLLAA